MNGSSLRPMLKVTADGEGIAAHCGTRLLADVADAVGLTAGLVAAMAPVCQAPRMHAPGRVLLDVALMLADGGDCLSDLATLGDQPWVFGPVASVPTAYRAIHAVDDARLAAIRGWPGWGSAPGVAGGGGAGVDHLGFRCHAVDRPFGQGRCGAHLQARFRVLPVGLLAR